MSAQKDDLETRFLRCIAGMPGAESVDTLRIPDGVPNADFLLAGRTGILEVKSLQTDVAPKVEEVLAPIRSRPDFPIFYGGWPLEKVLAKLKDGEQIKARVYERLSRSVRAAFRKADDQIAGTKRALGISDACGIVYFLNDCVDILTPEVVGHKLADLFREKAPDGRPRYSEIRYAVLLSEAHHLPTANGPTLVPIIELSGPTATYSERERAILGSVSRHWAASNGIPLFDAGESVPPGFLTRFKAARQEPQPTQMRRHELWRKQYRARPHLAGLSLDQFQEHGIRVTAEYWRSIKKGAPPLDRDQVLDLMERLTHFHEEVNRRGLDMREALPPERMRKAMGD